MTFDPNHHARQKAVADRLVAALLLRAEEQGIHPSLIPQTLSHLTEDDWEKGLHWDLTVYLRGLAITLLPFWAIIIALWILRARRLRAPSVLAAGLLLLIVVFNFNDFGILFRDVSLALAALARAFLPEPERHVARSI